MYLPVHFSSQKCSHDACFVTVYTLCLSSADSQVPIELCIFFLIFTSKANNLASYEKLNNRRIKPGRTTIHRRFSQESTILYNVSSLPIHRNSRWGIHEGCNSLCNAVEETPEINYHVCVCMTSIIHAYVLLACLRDSKCIWSNLSLAFWDVPLLALHWVRSHIDYPFSFIFVASQISSVYRFEIVHSGHFCWWSRRD